MLENQGEALEELGQRYERLFPVIGLYQFNLGLETEEALFQVTKYIRDQYFEGVEINKSTFPQIKEVCILYSFDNSRLICEGRFNTRVVELFKKMYKNS